MIRIASASYLNRAELLVESDVEIREGDELVASPEAGVFSKTRSGRIRVRSVEPASAFGSRSPYGETDVSGLIHVVFDNYVNLSIPCITARDYLTIQARLPSQLDARARSLLDFPVLEGFAELQRAKARINQPSGVDLQRELVAQRQRANALADRCGQLEHEVKEANRRAEQAESRAYRAERGKR